MRALALVPVVLVATLVWEATAATPASRTKLALTVADMPADFRVARPVRLVEAKVEARSLGVKTARYGRVAGVSASFKRDVSDFDDGALNQVDIALVFFRTTKGAHSAFEALVAKNGKLLAVHVGAESAGSGLAGSDVNVRWVSWRHANVVANLSGTYFAGHPGIRSLVALVRAQQARLARAVR